MVVTSIVIKYSVMEIIELLYTNQIFIKLRIAVIKMLSVIIIFIVGSIIAYSFYSNDFYRHETKIL